ncbi:MAG: hypothetical protein ABEH64_04235 [Salinirussus sp.]
MYDPRKIDHGSNRSTNAGPWRALILLLAVVLTVLRLALGC